MFRNAAYWMPVSAQCYLVCAVLFQGFAFHSYISSQEPSVLDYAKQLADQIENVADRDLVLSMIAREQATIQEYDKSYLTWSRIDGRQARLSALKAAALAAAINGHVNCCEKFVGKCIARIKLIDPEHELPDRDALVALILCESGQTQAASKFLVHKQLEPPPIYYSLVGDAEAAAVSFLRNHDRPELATRELTLLCLSFANNNHHKRVREFLTQICPSQWQVVLSRAIFDLVAKQQFDDARELTRLLNNPVTREDLKRTINFEEREFAIRQQAPIAFDIWWDENDAIALTDWENVRRQLRYFETEVSRSNNELALKHLESARKTVESLGSDGTFKNPHSERAVKCRLLCEIACKYAEMGNLTLAMENAAFIRRLGGSQAQLKCAWYVGGAFSVHKTLVADSAIPVNADFVLDVPIAVRSAVCVGFAAGEQYRIWEDEPEIDARWSIFSMQEGWLPPLVLQQASEASLLRRIRYADQFVGLDGAIPIYLKLLRQGRSALVRSLAAKTLGKLATSPEVETGLIAALDDEDLQVVLRAAYRLADFGRHENEIKAFIIPHLESSDKSVRARLAKILAKFRNKSLDVYSMLLDLSEDSNPHVRLYASLGLNPRDQQRVLSKLTRCHEPWIVVQSIRHLADIRSLSAESRSAIHSCLNDNSPFVQVAASKAILDLGSNNKIIENKLRSLTSSGSSVFIKNEAQRILDGLRNQK